MIFTIETFKKGVSRNGGISNEQIRALGVKFKKGKLPHKWKQRIIGTPIPEYMIEKYISLKDAHLKENKKYAPAYTYLGKVVACPYCGVTSALDEDKNHDRKHRMCKKCGKIFTIRDE